MPVLNTRDLLEMFLTIKYKIRNTKAERSLFNYFVLRINPWTRMLHERFGLSLKVKMTAFFSIQFSGLKTAISRPPPQKREENILSRYMPLFSHHTPHLLEFFPLLEFRL
jgi:hypothetical protein